MNMNVYIATSHDPFYNLAVENWLFHEILHDTPILYLWQNKPCVIIGRAQNPWRECNFNALNHDNIPIVRRQSGGGTVYHDLGNLNYTIMANADNYNKKGNLAIIINILKSCGINAHASAHNDILVPHDGFNYKVSGSAFRETREKSFHHGTLLVNANTSRIYDYLHHTIDESLTTIGVHSKRSRVINLVNINCKIRINILLDSFLQHFPQHITYLPDGLKNSLVITEENKLRTWQWRFGKTLPFSRDFIFNNTKFKLKIKNGQIVDLECRLDKGFSNLIQWIKESMPYYTKSSLSKASLNFTAQEEALLIYLYKQTEHVTETT